LLSFDYLVRLRTGDGIVSELWYHKHGDLSNGIPSHDTIRRVLCGFNPVKFSEIMALWGQAEDKDQRNDGDTAMGFFYFSMPNQYVLTYCSGVYLLSGGNVSTYPAPALQNATFY
jgi:hypothetical protein